MHLYGLDVPALRCANALIGPRRLLWHEVELDQQAVAPPTRTGVAWGDESVTLEAADHFSVEVAAGAPHVVRIRSPRPLGPAELVHPVMAFAGAVIATWTGRQGLHAAAVVIDGHAWLVLAPPGGGKSTVAACMHARGHAVLGDDLAVLDGHTVLAGPRSADLREEAAAQLSMGRLHHGPVGRDRWRTDLGVAPHEVPLGGMVVLEWGDEVSTRRSGIAERLNVLATFDALERGPATPSGFLDLLDVPVYRLQRPRRWSALQSTLSAIEDVAAAAVG